MAQRSDPDISVIVLAWRLTDPLITCVTAVRAQVGAPPAEIIVVVNGGSDEVLDAARRSGSDRVVESPVNLGFGGGISRGAVEARGRHLVFLNDDAIPDPGWLAALVSCVKSDQGIGAVASVLLNDDGTIQELGSRLLSSGGTRQWGRGLEWEAAETQGLLARRDIDYGSAAALLVRRDAFDAVSGFDPRYEPAYFEDVDLQLRLRLAGWRIMLEPTAIVTHRAGASTGGSEVYREFLGARAGSLFAARWREVLDAIDDDAPPQALAPVESSPVSRQSPEPEPIPVGALLTGGVVHPAVADEYVAWLVRRHRELTEQLRAQDASFTALQARLGETARDLRSLQEVHHETAQTAHALRQRVDELEAHPLRSLVRGLRRRA